MLSCGDKTIACDGVSLKEAKNEDFWSITKHLTEIAYFEVVFHMFV